MFILRVEYLLQGTKINASIINRIKVKNDKTKANDLEMEKAI